MQRHFGRPNQRVAVCPNFSVSGSPALARTTGSPRARRHRPIRRARLEALWDNIIGFSPVISDQADRHVTCSPRLDFAVRSMCALLVVRLRQVGADASKARSSSWSAAVTTGDGVHG